MTILCGTDFSVPAAGAVRAAAAIAARRGEALRLVHVLDRPLDGVAGEVRDPFLDLADSMLQQAAAQARELGAEVVVESLIGDVAPQLLHAAERSAASLVVVAWLGRRTPRRWLVGSVAERMFRSCQAPVLVVRDAASIVAWAGGGDAPLSVTIGDDLGDGSAAAIRWAASLAAIGPGWFTLAHLAWPTELHRKLGQRASADLEHLQPEVEATIRRQLRVRAEELGLPATTRIEVEQGYGRADAHLVSLAARDGADLVVVGAHQRAGLEAAWHGSVSRGVLHLASRNVASVSSLGELDRRPTPTVRNILVPTDLGERGNAAVRHAFALAPPSATVHLVHVATGDETEGEVMLRLARLIPRDAASKGVEAVCLALRGSVPDRIVATARRVGADLVCIGAKGPILGLEAAVFGSVTREVLARSTCPVLLVGAGGGS